MICWLDTETFCEVPIKNGTYIYAASAEIMLVLYAFDDGPVHCWDMIEELKIPQDLYSALEDENIILNAHNTMFDRNIFRLAKNATSSMRKAGNKIEHWTDTQVKAYAHGLPGALDTLGEIFGLAEDQKKIKEGKQLIQLFCKPQPKGRKIKRATSRTHPTEWAKFIEYGKNDVIAMRAIDKKIPSWNYKGEELALWHLDQKYNDAGICVDVELAEAAVNAVGIAQAGLNAQTIEMTSGEVDRASQRDKMLQHICAAYGVILPDMQADTIKRRINDESLPQALRDLLEVRIQSVTTSTSKYKTLLKSVSADDRLRGTTQFCGAQRTGRDGHRKFQPGNMPRLNSGAVKAWYGPNITKLEEEHIEEYLDFGVEALKANCADLLFDNVMALSSNLIRGCIIAPPGKKLVVSDLANIEGRMAAWLAGEDWKLKAFADYDTITGYREDGKAIRLGPDLYELSYARAFQVPIESVTKEQRQIGKVMELMLQYAGGVGAFITGAATYNIDLTAMAEAAWPSIPDDVKDEAKQFLQWLYEQNPKKDKEAIRFGLSVKEFLVCDSLKRLWRRAHPAIKTYWKSDYFGPVYDEGDALTVNLEDAARAAIEQPNKIFPCRKLKFMRQRNWLRMVLPSGRSLCYPGVKLQGKTITYLGINQYSRKWQRLKTYGGKLLENACQGASRDVLFYAQPEVEAAGFQIVLKVHDEIVSEAPSSEEFNHEVLSSILAKGHSWTKGLPLAAAGFECTRYRKG